MDHELEARWYAVAVRSRQEKAAAADLQRRLFHVFLPLRLERHRWSDRWKTIEKALFPGYLFVHAVMSPECRVDLLKSPQVQDLVGRTRGSRLVEHIPEVEIESVRHLLQSQRELESVNQLIRGKKVTVVAGPLKGTQGLVEQEPDGQQRLVVQITLLGRGVRAHLHADDVLAGGDEIHR